MPTWGWALLLKPLAAIGVFAVVFGVPMLLARLLRPVFPKGRLKNYLFRERGGQSASRSADAGQDALHRVTLIGRESPND